MNSKVKALVEAANIMRNFISSWADCLAGVQMSHEEFEKNCGLIEYRQALAALEGEPVRDRSRVWQTDENGVVSLVRCKNCNTPTGELEGESGGWLPIETAPKDGTYIIGFCIASRSQVIVSWHEDRDAWLTETCAWFGKETLSHWTPLPTPPAGGSDE